MDSVMRKSLFLLLPLVVTNAHAVYVVFVMNILMTVKLTMTVRMAINGFANELLVWK